MFKIKVRVDVVRGNTTKQETFETMVDHETWRKLGSSRIIWDVFHDFFIDL